MAPEHPDSWKARDRISARFALGGKQPVVPLTSYEAFRELGHAMHRDARDVALLGVQAVDREDLLAGLTLADEARWQANLYLDVDELDLLTTLRADGVEWAEVGRGLGYPPGSAARLAAARWHRLRKRHPGNAAAIDKRLAERDQPGDSSTPDVR